MSYAPFDDARPLLDQPEKLREKMADDGFLYVSRLINSPAVNSLRDQILTLCQNAGWADDRGHALGAPRLEGHADWWDVYDPLQKLEEFHRLAHRPELLRLIGAIVGEPILPHPRNIARITFPNTAHFTTPPHQDHPLIQGAPETFTAWIPLVNCPIALGGLALLPGSHQAGLLPVHAASGPGGLTVHADANDRIWQARDMNAGDVLLFHSLTVHQALPNTSEKTLRLSVDYRYQNAEQSVVPDSLEPHYGRLTWDEIYADWPASSPLRRYWRELPLKVAARDAALQTPTLPDHKETNV